MWHFATTRRAGLVFVALLVASILSAGVASAQTTVRGVVTEADSGIPLPGVNIGVKGTTIGTASNVNGEYEISVPADRSTLVFSFVGYRTQEHPVPSGAAAFNVELEPDVLNLDEVVVTGLATSVKRENLANAVTSLTARELTETVDPQTLDAALNGKIPGVNIRSNTGAPGGGFNVQMRGISTLGAGNSQPLYIVDGVWVNNDELATGLAVVNGASSPTSATRFQQDNSANRLADLNPDDIETIEVLKGASAAAIYGQRANAGVVIITTKKGKPGRTNVRFSQDVGANTALNLLGVASWDEAKIDLVFGQVLGRSPEAVEAEKEKFRQAQAAGRLIDYEDEVYGNTGISSNSQISVSGGNANTQFFLSAGLRDEEGIINNTGFVRKSVRANAGHSISDQIRVTANASYVNTDSDRGFTGNQNNTGGSIGYALAFVPTYADLRQREDGSFPDNAYFGENPLRLIEQAVNTQEINRLLGSLSLGIDFYQRGNTTFSFTAQGGLDYLVSDAMVFFPEFFQFQRGQPNPGDVMHAAEEVMHTNLQGFLVFNTALGPEAAPLGLTTQVGATRFTQNQDRELVRGRGLAPGQTNVQNAAIQEIFDQRFVEVTDLGYAAQQEVNWADRLIATVGGRVDRSTLNVDQDKYYFYPKASLAVNLHNFMFWGVPVVDQLKLRTAYGETGGLPTFGNTFTALNSVNIGGGLGSVLDDDTVDPSLKPERARELEAGLDLGLANGHLSLEATYYVKTIEDLILPLTPAGSTGLDDIITNAAELENRGWEAALTVAPFRSRDFAWNSRFLFWKNESEITRLDIPPFNEQALGFIGFGFTRMEEGESPTALWGLDADGNNAKFGDWMPDFELSWSNEFTLFRDLSFSFLWHWSEGAENINLSSLLGDAAGTTFDWNADDDGDGTPNGLDRPSLTEAWVEDASYVKLREVALYYTLPQRLLRNSLGDVVQRLRLGISGHNLVMFTPYDGYDPEVNFSGNQVLTPSVEITPFPSTRSVSFHLQLDL